MAVSSALFGQWQVSPHLPYNGPLHHYPSSAWKVLLFSLLHPSLHTPSASPLCCWCNIMSVGEGMACLCAPEGLPTHCWEEKTTRAWMPLSPSLFKHPFTPTTTTMVLGLCGTALFLSLTHPQTHKEGWWQQRLGGEDWVWFCVFSPHMLVQSDSSGTWDPNAIESLLSLPSFLCHHLFIRHHSFQNAGVLQYCFFFSCKTKMLWTIKTFQLFFYFVFLFLQRTSTLFNWRHK